MSRVATVWCAVVGSVPRGTNLGWGLRWWLLLTGRRLGSRGAVLPALSALGLSPAGVRRSWAALGQGAWTADQVLANWPAGVAQEGVGQPHLVGGYPPVAGDTTGGGRPPLQECPTPHDRAAAGKALSAIPLGILARVGSAHGQRRGVPRALGRAPAGAPRPRAPDRVLVQQAVAVLTAEDAWVVDRAFGGALVPTAAVTAPLPKGWFGQRRPKAAPAAGTAAAPSADAAAHVAA